jgi:hypothetical protein
MATPFAALSANPRSKPDWVGFRAIPVDLGTGFDLVPIRRMRSLIGPDQSFTIGPRSKVLSAMTGLLHAVTELEVDIPGMRLPVVTTLGPY